MNGETSTFGESLELDFKGKTVRALMVNGVPWMALSDILRACGYNHHAAEYVHRDSFPSFGKMVAGEEYDPEVSGDPEDQVLLSPTGIHYWSDRLDPARTAKFTAWARREARRLCPKPVPDDPTFHLALVTDADGWTHVPPGPPSRYSGWHAEWDNLKWSGYSAWCAAERSNADWNIRQRKAA